MRSSQEISGCFTIGTTTLTKFHDKNDRFPAVSGGFSLFLITLIILMLLFPLVVLMVFLIKMWADFINWRTRRRLQQATPIDLERNRALNAAWADLMIIDPVYAARWRKRYPEYPNPSKPELY